LTIQAYACFITTVFA